MVFVSLLYFLVGLIKTLQDFENVRTNTLKNIIIKNKIIFIIMILTWFIDYNEKVLKLNLKE